MNRVLNWKFGMTSVASALVLALAGCGGGSDAGTAATSTTTTPTSGGTASLTYATYSATPYTGGAATAFTVTSMTVTDAGYVAPNPAANRITVLGTGGGFEREIKIYVKDSDCSIISISHAWAATAAGLLGPTAVSTSVSTPAIGTALGLDPATNTVTLNDTLLSDNVPHVSTLKGTVKPSTKICASAVV